MIEQPSFVLLDEKALTKKVTDSIDALANKIIELLADSQLKEKGDIYKSLVENYKQNQQLRESLDELNGLISQLRSALADLLKMKQLNDKEERILDYLMKELDVSSS